MARVRALTDFSYQTREYRPGDVLEVAPVEALALARRGRISLARLEASVPVTEPEPEPVRPKRRYRRRDLTAETA